MNALATQIQAGSPLALGASRFVPYDPVLPTREWDASDWGHYRPRG